MYEDESEPLCVMSRTSANAKVTTGARSVGNHRRESNSSQITGASNSTRDDSSPKRPKHERSDELGDSSRLNLKSRGVSWRRLKKGKDISGETTPSLAGP